MFSLLFFLSGFLSVTIVRVSWTGQGRGFSLSDSAREGREREDIHSGNGFNEATPSYSECTPTILAHTNQELTVPYYYWLTVLWSVPQSSPNSVHLNWGIAPVAPGLNALDPIVRVCCTWFFWATGRRSKKKTVSFCQTNWSRDRLPFLIFFDCVHALNERDTEAEKKN